MKNLNADPESRLRLHAQVFSRLEPSSALLRKIAARTVTQAPASGKRSAARREFALAAGFLLFAGTLAFGAAYIRTLNSQAPASTDVTKPSAVPTIAPSVAADTAVKMLPGQVPAFIEARVTTARPLLLPTALPASAAAYVTADANGFTVEYRTKSVDIVLSTMAANLPADGETRAYRGGHAVYQATNPADPHQGQFLSWTEPGQSTLNPAAVPYFLKVGGMTEAQFWQLANSMR